MRKPLALFFAALLFAVACSKGKDEHAVKAGITPKKVGQEAVTARFVEQDSFNIPYWLESGEKSRILVRFSGQPGIAAVSGEAMDNIKSLAGKADYDGLMKAGNMLAPGHAYDSGSVAYVAHRLGIVRELYWIVPSFAPLAQEDLDSFKEYMKDLYPSESSAIDAMELKDGTAEGSVNGVPVKLVGLDGMKPPDEPVLLDIDASFFQALYKDEKQTASLPFIAGMFKLMSSAGIVSDSVSLSASGEDGTASFRFRVFARYIESLLKEPRLIESKPPELWSERMDAWRTEQKDPEAALVIYKNMISRYPDDAASRYDLANLYFGLGEFGLCADMLAEAASIDPGYGAAFGGFREMLLKDGKDDAAERFFAGRPASGG